MSNIYFSNNVIIYNKKAIETIFVSKQFEGIVNRKEKIKKKKKKDKKEKDKKDKKEKS